MLPKECLQSWGTAASQRNSSQCHQSFLRILRTIAGRATFSRECCSTEVPSQILSILVPQVTDLQWSRVIPEHIFSTHSHGRFSQELQMRNRSELCLTHWTGISSLHTGSDFVLL